MNHLLTTLISAYANLPYAETYAPCDRSLLSESAALLVDSGHAWSDELTDFYLISNGFFYNGIYIFSVRSSETAEHLDILVQNVQWDIAERLPGCVLFGRSDEEVYVYNSQLKAFQILDFTGWDEYYQFDSLAGLFEFVVSERS